MADAGNDAITGERGDQANRSRPGVDDILCAIDQLSRRRRLPFQRRRRCFTRHEIASQLAVDPAQVSAEGQLVGPLADAVQQGLVQPDPRDKGYWCLTAEGQARLDQGAFT